MSKKQKPTEQDKQKALSKINKTKGSDDATQEVELKSELGNQYTASYNALQTIRQTWDDKESMLIGVNRDSISGSTKSQVNDPRLATIIIERAARVMAQLPTGEVQALTQKDKGKNSLMNLVVSKYIYPNANSQFDLLTKFRMWDIYSSMYGSMPSLVDYVISDDYVGPDCYLTPIRSFLPQQGKISIKECDHSFIDTWVSVGWLKSRNPKFWKNLDDIIKEASKGGESPSSKDSEKRSLVEREKYPWIQGGKGDSAQVLITTRYERDRWVTFVPDYDCEIIRDIENPQNNNRIPIVLKHCFPLLDSIIGLGEFERGKTLQFAINSLINLYLDGVKMSIFPPIMVDPTGVVASSIRFNPAQKWLVTKPGSIDAFKVNPQGIASFQSTYTFLIGALLNMAGTTDTTITQKTDPGQGKTPEALKMLGQRESARDNWDRYLMEKAVEETLDIMVDMVATKQEKPIEFDLFEQEIKQIEKNEPDIKEMFDISDSGKYAKVTLKKGQITGTKYRFFIDAGTSMKEDDDEINQVATNLLLLFIKNPQLIGAMQKGTNPKTVDFAELVQIVINTSGLPNANKVLIDMTANPPDQNQKPPGDVMVQVKADAATPQGEAILEEQGILPQNTPPQPAPAAGGTPQPVTPNLANGQASPNSLSVGGHQFKNPEIAALARQLMAGGAQPNA